MSVKSQNKLYKHISREIADDASWSHIGSCVMPTCVVWYDESIEENGDYAPVARLFFSDLSFDVLRPRHSCLARIRKNAEAIQKREGEQFQVSSSGQFVTLGYAKKTQ